MSSLEERIWQIIEQTQPTRTGETNIVAVREAVELEFADADFKAVNEALGNVIDEVRMIEGATL